MLAIPFCLSSSVFFLFDILKGSKSKRGQDLPPPEVTWWLVWLCKSPGLEHDRVPVDPHTGPGICSSLWGQALHPACAQTF